MPLKLIMTQSDLAQLEPGSVFVPTMGALHEGHAALIRAAAAIAKPLGLPVSVSIFVNPTQFNDPADFARYPKTLDADIAICEASGAELIFAPELNVMYPKGVNPATGKTWPGDIPVPPLPFVATQPGLEDGFRPGHFAGVCQVVNRLFKLVRPAHAIFGEKDWQQLQVLTAMTHELGLPIQIHGYPTIRESDGLALSSRNRFLSPADRQAARSLSQALSAACKEPTLAAAEAAMKSVLLNGGAVPDYAVVRSSSTLLEDPSRPQRALIAARVGPVRLIDNCKWPEGY